LTRLSELASHLALGGHLAADSLVGRLPGLVVFAAGMLVGALAAAAATIVPRHSRSARAVAWLAAPAVPAAPAAVPPEFPRTRGAPDHPAVSARPAVRAVQEREPARPAEPARVPSLRIGVLGSLTINGQAGALVPAQSQLIVALALHGDGLSNQRLRALLGADSGHPKPADSLRQLIARTRRALGRAPDGREWIEHLGHGQYALHPDARVDWREFDALTGSGTRLGLPGPLTEALSMIRGQPFTGCYYWWLETAVVESVTGRIVAAAEKLAELSLAGQDPAAAVRAARIGLAADSSAEQLWRIMMRAEHAAGNLAGVREAWGRCVDVASEMAADGQPDSATSAVYDQLLAR
jgi:DNA-binding SARP family transcriptional activator